MIVRLLRRGAFALLPFILLAAAASAQTPKPSPSPEPTPVAFVAHAHADATVVIAGRTYTGTAQLGMAQRGNLVRIDVLSVKSDAFAIPPITLSAVIDRGANTLTVWNDTTKLYKAQPLIPHPAPSASPRANATPPPPRGGVSPFSRLDVFEMTLKLTGHTTTAGFPSTGMLFDFQVRSRGQQALSHVTATTQLADEFAAFPLTIDLSIEPGAAPGSAKLSYAVDDLTRGTATARFDVPAGYAEAPSLMGVIFPRRPVARPTPAPAASSAPR